VTDATGTEVVLPQWDSAWESGQESAQQSGQESERASSREAEQSVADAVSALNARAALVDGVEPVSGHVLQAVAKGSAHTLLVRAGDLAGDAGTLRPLLDTHGAAAEIEVAHAAEVIPMGDSGVRIGGLPGTSAAVACGLVASGQAGALVSAGSTGGTVATAVATLGCAPGVLRPAIAVMLPTPGRGTVLLDAGATADPTPEMLAQFAVLGTGYARAVLGLESPTVGLLTIGSEPGKGNRLARRAQPLLCSAAVRFTGNVEGRDALAGAVDVVVTDGFTGNIALKLMESVSQTMLGAVREAAMSSTRAKLGGALLRPALRGFRDEIDPEANGGAYLLGLRRLGVVPHGRFTRAGFAQAILRAERGARADIVGRTHSALEQAGALKRAPVSAPAASLPHTG